MVERLKIAVEKARAERARAEQTRRAAPPDQGGVSGDAARAPSARHPAADEDSPLMLGSAEAPRIATDADVPVPATPFHGQDPGTSGDLEVRRAAAWNALSSIEFSRRHLEKNRIISYAKTDPAHVAIDVLRTRILSALARKGWTRVGITSPNVACGKTFVAANLAISLARQAQSRTVLIDMDMRRPTLARVLGARKQEALRWFLEGAIPAGKFFQRFGSNLALGLNSRRMDDASELIQAPSTAHALATMQAQLSPDVILYDLPPMLTGDDVTGFLPNLDCVLLVIGGGLTRPSEVTECEHILENHCPLLGVVLNKGEGVKVSQYAYY